MRQRFKHSGQIDAAYKVGELEARVSTDDPTLTAADFTVYLINCEIADMMADNRVLKFILDKDFISKRRRLNKQYKNYKAKYWK